MIDICKQIMDVMIIPIKLFENVLFNKIWLDILEYTVLHKEAQLVNDDFPFCLAGMFE